MNKEAYKNIIQQGVKVIEVDGEKHYFKLPSYLDIDLFSMIKEEDMEQNKKMLMCLACIIVDENGKRIFDDKDPEDLDIIKGLPNALQAELITKMAECFFPGESKAQV